MTAIEGNAELVMSVYQAIGEGDIPTVLGAMADDVEIRFPGPSVIPFAGVFQGHSGVGDFFTAIGGSTEVHEFQPLEFISQDNLVVVLGRERITALPTGRTWATDWAMVWTVESGRIQSLHEYHETATIGEAFAN
jgi:uncharacterized protein